MSGAIAAGRNPSATVVMLTEWRVDLLRRNE
jgi:choline dehydrogenase-like flavoprotein